MKKSLLAFFIFAFSFSYGQVWDSVAAGIDDTNSSVSALTVYNGKLCVGGKFRKAGNILANFVASWDDTKWGSLGSGVSSIVYALDTFQSNLFVGGEFDSAGGITAGFIAQWNGLNWDSVGGGMNGRVFSFADFDSVLYVGGQFLNAGYITTNTNSIAQWN